MATPVLPEELLLLIIDNVPATHELLALRLAARNLNRLVLNKFHKLTGQREYHPFSRLRWGLDPRYLHGIELLSQSESIRHLPFGIEYDTACLVDRDTPTRISYEYMKEGSWLDRYGMPWGALQLLLMGLRHEFPETTEEINDYLPNRHTDCRILQRHEDKYAEYMESTKGQELLERMLSLFPNLSLLSLGHKVDTWHTYTCPKRAFPDHHNLDGASLQDHLALHEAIQFESTDREFCGRHADFLMVLILLKQVRRKAFVVSHLEIFESPYMIMAPHMHSDSSLSQCINLEHVQALVLNVVEGRLLSDMRGPWAIFLERARCLKRLEIGASIPFDIDPETGQEDGQWTSDRFFYDCIKGRYWEYLESFKLANFLEDPDDLHEFLIRHKGTLSIFCWEPSFDTKFGHVSEYLVRWRRLLSLKEAHILFFGKSRWERSLRKDWPHHKAIREMVQDQLAKDSPTMDFGCCVIRSAAGSRSSSVLGSLDDTDIDI